MKKLILILLTVNPFSSFASSRIDFPESVKQIIFEEITANVFFEDEGFIREPSDLKDFTFTQVDEFVIRVTGDSYSDWDMKTIGYDCMVNVLTRGQIKSSKDIEVKCSLTGENWPND